MDCQKVQIFGRAQNVCSENCWVHVSLDLRKSNFRSVQAVFNFKLSDGTSKTNAGGGDSLCCFVPSVSVDWFIEVCPPFIFEWVPCHQVMKIQYFIYCTLE